MKLKSERKSGIIMADELVFERNLEANGKEQEERG